MIGFFNTVQSLSIRIVHTRPSIFSERRIVNESTKAVVSGDDADDAKLMSKSKKSNKRDKYIKKSPGVLVTNQQQQIADAAPSKKAGKKFFTSKQRKHEQPADKSVVGSIGSNQGHSYEDRENVPRVPPLKLRLKAALSIGSFSNLDGKDGDNKATGNDSLKI